jgi:hypothetical protein
MSDLFPDDTSTTRSLTGRAKVHPRVRLPDGDYLVPRREWAAELGITDRTARRMNLPTIFLGGGAAYVKHDASTLLVIERRMKQANEPPRRPGRRRRNLNPKARSASDTS